MKFSQTFLGWLCLAALGLAEPGADPCPSYLYDACYRLDYCFHGLPRPYLPQPGDVMLATDKNLFWKITHDMAFAFEPHGSGIIVARADGSLGVFEAGGNDTMKVQWFDMLPHLKEYADKGPIWIRKRKAPLTQEQSACLTDFAERQWGKRFALGRLGLQLTPIRQRGPLRTSFLGKAQGDRVSYWCSELVVEAGVAAGIMDRETARPGATYPHDLFFDQSYNRYINQHPPLVHDWEPPARWEYRR